MNRSSLIVICIALAACGRPANGDQVGPATSSLEPTAERKGTSTSPQTNSGPKWLTGEGSITTSIGDLTWRSSNEETKSCLLINGKALLGHDDISCQNVDVNVVDYGGSITVIGTSNSGGASSLPYYKIVHVDRTWKPASTIEFGAPDEIYELDWKAKSDAFVSSPFDQDGKRQFVQLLPSGVQLVGQSISQNEAAPDKLCTAMKDALSQTCSEATDCKDIESGFSHVEQGWFDAAKSDPRFNYGKFMAACVSACKGSKVDSDHFQLQYCKAGK